MREFLTGKTLAERIRDWDWNLNDIWLYVLELLKYHIDRLGWTGWIIVPFVVWVLMLLWRPSRYIASLVGMDIYRNTLSNFIGSAFRTGEAIVVNGFGLFIARLRGTVRFLQNWFRS